MDYYKHFMSLVEMVEQAYGKVMPVEIAKKSGRYSSKQSEVEDDARKMLLAFIFMDGTDKKVFGPLLKDLNSDYALGNAMYPKTVEDALQVLTIYIKKHGGSSGNPKEESDKIALGFAQESRKIICWKCKKEGHLKRECPQHNQTDQEDSTNLQVSWAD